jgi:hypothetical protein
MKIRVEGANVGRKDEDWRGRKEAGSDSRVCGLIGSE